MLDYYECYTKLECDDLESYDDTGCDLESWERRCEGQFDE